MKFKLVNDVTEAVEASAERQAEAKNALLGMIAGRGVAGWYTQDERDRPNVSRRTAPGRWSGADPHPVLAEAVERALGGR